MLTYQTIAPHIGAGKTEAQIADAINADPPAEWSRPLTSREALAWLGIDGRMVAFEAAADNTALPDNLRGAIKATRIAVERIDTALDLSPGSVHRLLLLGCAQAGIFDVDDVTALIASCRLVADITGADVAACKLQHETHTHYEAAMSACLVAMDSGESVADCKAALIAGWEGA